MRQKTFRQRRDLFLRQAIEKEVRDQQVVFFLTGMEAAQIGLNCMQTRLDMRRIAKDATSKLRQHRGARINGICLDERVCRQQARSEAAISVAKDQRLTCFKTPGKKMEPAALQHRPKAEVFHPTIDAGQRIEIWRVGNQYNDAWNMPDDLFATYMLNSAIRSVLKGKHKSALHPGYKKENQIDKSPHKRNRNECGRC